MKEIEIKVLNIAKRSIQARLRKLGAIKIYEGIMKVRYFDFPDRRIQKAHDLLRARELGDGQVEVVYKSCRKSHKNFKQMNEISFGGNNFAAMRLFFKKIGLKETIYYEKKRQSFQFKKIKVEIDEYPNRFCYLEIEAATEKKIEEGIRCLGLDGFERSTETVDEMFERKFGRGSLNGLRF